MASSKDIHRAQFTVASSAEDLRMAARAGDLSEAVAVISRYTGDTNDYAKFLPAVIGAADNTSGNRALHFCAANGHKDIVQLLCTHGVDVNATNMSGSTALHYASLTGQLEVVKVLLQNCARPVVENKYSKTALDEARSGRHEDVAKFLLEHVESMGSAPDLQMDGENRKDEKEGRPSRTQEG